MRFNLIPVSILALSLFAACSESSFENVEPTTASAAQSSNSTSSLPDLEFYAGLPGTLVATPEISVPPSIQGYELTGKYTYTDLSGDKTYLYGMSESDLSDFEATPDFPKIWNLYPVYSTGNSTKCTNAGNGCFTDGSNAWVLYQQKD